MNTAVTAAFGLSLLVSAQAAHAAEHETKACLNGKAAAEIALDLNKGRYIEGSIRFSGLDFANNGASLTAVSDGLERVLFQNQTAAQQFLLWLPTQRQAILKLRAPQNRRLCYGLALKQGHAVYDAGVRTNAAPQSKRLQTLQGRLKAGDGNAAAAFWREIAQTGAPMVETLADGQKLMTFLYRGAKHNVRLVGAPSNDHEWLSKLPGTDIWYKSFAVPDDVRLSYRLAPDVPVPVPVAADKEKDEKEQAFARRRALLSVLQTDALNPKKFGGESFADLNRPSFSDGLKKPQGRLKQYAFESKRLNNTRRVWIYQTDPHAAAEPVWLYLFDGFEYLHKADTPAVLDRLRRENKIPPVVAVLIDNHDRRRELPADAAFADMLAGELVPFAERATGLRHQAARAVVAGSSYGGLASAYAACRHPQYFANVIPMSGSFWWRDKQGRGMKERFAAPAQTPQRWYITAGSYETARPGEAAEQGIAFASRRLAAVLNAHGHQAVYREYSGGHDYAVWQQALADGLVYLFGTD